MAEEYMQVDVVTPERAVLSRKAFEGGRARKPGRVRRAHRAHALSHHPEARPDHRAHRGQGHYLACGGGFAEVISNRVIILAETADMAEDLKIEEVREELEQAREKLRQFGKDDPEGEKWEKRLYRAEIKQRVLENWEKSK
jgi:F-type H+-transporting ATPase subunit epsilon